MSSENEVQLVDLDKLEVALSVESGNLTADCLRWCETYGWQTNCPEVPPEAEAALLRLLLSRLTDAQRWELFRELAGELLPRVHCSRADVGWCWMDGNWTSYVTACGGETHATVHPNALHRPEELRLLAACCLAAADELERRDNAAPADLHQPNLPAARARGDE